MFARIATFEGGDTEQLRRMNEDPGAGRPDLPDGIRRAMMLDAGGRRQFITFFDSREAIAAAEARFESMGDEIDEDVRGKRTGVEVWEVIFDQEL
jgi:hypothetical protein